MTNLFKKVALVVCSVLAVCCLAVGCDIIDNDPMAANAVDYIVTVAAEDGSSVSGIDVVFSKEGAEDEVYMLDESGVVVAEIPADVYTVTLANVPSGYLCNTVLTTVADYSYLTFVVKKANYTVILEAEGNATLEGVEAVFTLDGASTNYAIDSTGKVEVVTPAAEYEVSLTNLPAGYSCDAVKVTGTDYSEVVFYVEKYAADAVSVENVNVNPGDNNLYEVEMENYVFESTSAYVVVTLENAEDKAYISIHPAFVGKYELSVDAEVVIEEYPYSTYVNGSTLVGSGVGSYTYEVVEKYFLKSVENAETGKVEFVEAEEYVNVFAFSAPEAEGPVSYVIYFNRVGEATPDNTVYHVVDGTDLPVASMPDGYDEYFSAEPVPYGSEIYYNETDGYYHLGDVDGEVIYVAITANNRYTNENFAYVYGQGQTLSSASTDSEGVLTIKDYSKYILDDLTIKSTYDGYYPCTQNLYVFLNYFVENTGYFLNGVEEDQQWLAFCYYYVDNGDGSYFRPFTATYGDYVAAFDGMNAVAYAVTAPKDDTVTVTTTTADAVIEVYTSENSWMPEYVIEGAGKYTFDVVAGQYFKIVISNFDYVEENIDVTITTAFVYDVPTAGDGSEIAPYEIGEGAFLALNAPDCMDWSAAPITYKYVATKNGTVTVATLADEDNAAIMGYNETSGEYMDNIFNTGSYTYNNVTAGDVIIILVYAADVNKSCDIGFSVTWEIKLETPVSGEGTQDNPYVIGNGTYQAVDVDGFNGKVYSYTVAEAGKVTISNAAGETNNSIYVEYFPVDSDSDFPTTSTSIYGVNSEKFTVAAGDKLLIYVTTDNYLVDNIEFEVTWSEDNGEDEGGDEEAEAGTMGNPIAIEAGTIDYVPYIDPIFGWADATWYSFTATESGTLRIYTTTNPENYPSIMVYTDNVNFETVTDSSNENFVNWEQTLYDEDWNIIGSQINENCDAEFGFDSTNGVYDCEYIYVTIDVVVGETYYFTFCCDAECTFIVEMK